MWWEGGLCLSEAYHLAAWLTFQQAEGQGGVRNLFSYQLLSSLRP